MTLSIHLDSFTPAEFVSHLPFWLPNMDLSMCCHFTLFFRMLFLQFQQNKRHCYSFFIKLNVDFLSLCLVSLSQVLFYDDILVLVVYWTTCVYYTNSCNNLRCYFPALPICNCSSSILLLLYTTQQNETCTCTSTSSQPRAIVHHQISLYVAVDAHIWPTCLVCDTNTPAGRAERWLGFHVSKSSSFFKKFQTF